jgi:archaeal type IV pilus assembly protein PilA
MWQRSDAAQGQTCFQTIRAVHEVFNMTDEQTPQEHEWQTREYGLAAIERKRNGAKWSGYQAALMMLVSALVLVPSGFSDRVQAQLYHGEVWAWLLFALTILQFITTNEEWGLIRYLQLRADLQLPIITHKPTFWGLRQWYKRKDAEALAHGELFVAAAKAKAERRAQRHEQRKKDDEFGGTRGDEGVSPVIAVILLVAITVVLAATVYVWVSNFSTGAPIQAFPQITARDATDALTAGTTDKLVTLSHRGGEGITLSRYSVALDGNTSGIKLVTSTGATPTMMTVGDEYTLKEDGVNTAEGTHTLRIIDTEGQAVVWEHDLFIR